MLTFSINFVQRAGILLETLEHVGPRVTKPTMRQNQTSHYSRENRYFYLSVAPWSRTKFYKLQVQKEKPAVFASHPHTVGRACRSRGNVCCVAFSLTSGTAVEQADYRQTPTLPTARWLRKQEGEEMVVASTDSKKIGVGWDLCGWRVPYI